MNKDKIVFLSIIMLFSTVSLQGMEDQQLESEKATAAQLNMSLSEYQNAQRAQEDHERKKRAQLSVYEKEAFAGRPSRQAFEENLAEKTLYSFLTDNSGQSLGQLIEENETLLFSYGQKLDHLHPEYHHIIRTLKQIKSVNVEAEFAIDVSDLQAEAKLNALQSLTEFPPCLKCNNALNLPWYKKYRSHIALSIGSLFVGSILTLGITKWFGPVIPQTLSQ